MNYLSTMSILIYFILLCPYCIIYLNLQNWNWNSKPMFVQSCNILENFSATKKWLSPGRKGADKLINLCYLSVCVFLSVDPCVLLYVIGGPGKIYPDLRPESKRERKLWKMWGEKYEEWVVRYQVIKRKQMEIMDLWHQDHCEREWPGEVIKHAVMS